ncbi:MAG TPA: translation elongation factor Ts [Lacipirellulaceae bacterium]|jgi:elongation factor Ts|nr:translation elongation factor Ts [Lacipirellulaceae bacterium]
MAEITAAQVMKLRDETSLPMMDCKKALQESGGDFEAAKRTLREKGIKIMGMRADRPTEEGRIAVYTSLNPGVGAIVELQVESAPVAKHEDIVALANDLAKQLATGPGAKTPEDLWKQPAPSRKGVTLQHWKDEIEGKMREVLRLARIERWDAPTGGYVHHDAKSGVLLQVEGGNDELAKSIAMHVAAMKPKAATTAELDKALVDKERSILTEQAKKEGKPDNIIEKMIEGRMRNFYAENVLSEQPFVKDDKQSVGKVAAAGGMKLLKFKRWQLGETTGDKPAA